MYEDAYDRVRELEASLEDDELKLDERRRVSEQLRKLYRALGEKAPSEDELVDKWEQELAEGKIPDLDEQPTT